MKNKILITGCFFFLLSYAISAQEKKQPEKETTSEEVLVDSVQLARKTIDPLSPSKAAFYSAVLPGLGQAYNKKYWKIPLVYGALGTGVYFYIHNTNEYNRYRDAYKSRLAGFETDEFYYDAEGNKLASPRVTTDGLQRGQKFYRRNRELSLLVLIGMYALNIIDANVDAHLLQFNVDQDLSLNPHYELNNIDSRGHFGVSLNLKF
ncbi:DUF5683 domain-containing protein [Gaetbulibacter aestuarii]|uniref:DUF5683 domain-containing protein n=1 Tax=Gaetbulibacter aestuarii TaxID=1502358 RepID=A0ABW7MWU3_9FLAO